MADIKLKSVDKNRIGEYIGEYRSVMEGAKLYHWDVTGTASYAQHIALDQFIEQMNAPVDSLAETSIALYGDINITIPKTDKPANIVDYINKFRISTKNIRNILIENVQIAIVDTIDEAALQVLYRLKRLK